MANNNLTSRSSIPTAPAPASANTAGASGMEPPQKKRKTTTKKAEKKSLVVVLRVDGGRLAEILGGGGEDGSGDGNGAEVGEGTGSSGEEAVLLPLAGPGISAVVGRGLRVPVKPQRKGMNG